MPSANVGEQVLYYAHGDNRHQAQVAFVTNKGGGGRLSLVVLDSNGYPTPKGTVPHLADPIWQSTPKPEWLHNTGGWDFVEPSRDTLERLAARLAPYLVPQVLESLPKPSTATIDVDGELMAKIRAMVEEGLPAHTIHRRIGVKTMPLDELKRVIALHEPVNV